LVLDNLPSMKVFDISFSKEYLKYTNPDADLDKSYTFYYDETNNFKKLYIKELDFNASFASNFILGGLVFEGTSTDLSNLFEGLELQNNIVDVKLKHLATGSFLDCLKSKKLNYFLKYLYDNKIYIHFTWVNLLQWSIADIVDSAIANSEVAIKAGRPMADRVKSDFYKLAKIELEAVIALFYKFKYPNIKKEQIVPFINELISLFDGYIHTEEFHFGLESLRQVLKEAKRNQSLPFLTNEEDYVLLKDFSTFYLEPLALFKNSLHVFDNEDSIAEIVQNTKIMDGKDEIKNYSFIDSKSNPIVQASDIFVGIMGKLSTFLNTSGHMGVCYSISSLSEIQESNIDLIIDLMDRSGEKNPAFITSIDTQEEMKKVRIIRHIRNKL
jgi:uncharacterized protein DUF3800